MDTIESRERRYDLGSMVTNDAGSEMWLGCRGTCKGTWSLEPRESMDMSYTYWYDVVRGKEIEAMPQLNGQGTPPTVARTGSAEKI